MSVTAVRKPAALTEPSHALIYVMVLLSAADGDMADNELGIIGDMVRHLPVFRSFDIHTLPDVARECTTHLAHPEGMRHVLQVVRAALPERLYETAYAVACDMAAADGGISQEERRLLKLLRDELGLDRLHAAAIERGARARYLVV